MLGHYLRDLKGILASLDKSKELLKYVRWTSRFKMMLGDAIGDESHLEPEEGWQIASPLLETTTTGFNQTAKLAKASRFTHKIPPLSLPALQLMDLKRQSPHDRNTFTRWNLQQATHVQQQTQFLLIMLIHSCARCLQLGTWKMKHKFNGLQWLEDQLDYPAHVNRCLPKQ